ncbi:MAG: 3-hydroxyacyl-CoA dehydrogenase [Proteobacteria bacterium]|nr:3-hydroxyacyl-CoA dehydrogenase [Pseudomonadota bacterium]NOG59594.1 3-hydroxyacyl-CoA dehydrogenase [Pseudomonadota bacterium]
MQNIITYKKIGHIALVTINNPPVNAMDFKTRLALSDAIDQLNSDNKIKAAVLICEGRTFIAGADISEFDNLPFKDPWLPDVVQKIEDANKPVIAAIHGSALGGGLEIAMGCHFRCAVPSAKLGLPEVTLGLLPGATGTQRLPRLIGVDKALDMMLTGKPINAKQAIEEGLIDKIIEDELQEGAIAFAKEILEKQIPIRRLSKTKIDKTNVTTELFEKYRQRNNKTACGFFAPEKIIQCVEAAVDLPYPESLQVEDNLFMECLNSDHSRGQRHLFFAEREIARIPDVPKDTAIRNINRVAIIGAGTMGGGIAMNFLQANIPVTLLEIDQEGLQRGIDIIRSNYAGQVKKGRMEQTHMDQYMELLSGSTAFDNISDVDLVIEAVFENMEIKKEVFKKLDQVCKPGAILASNTSTLDLDVIANYTKRPEDVIGLHFFAPANIMPLLEIVRGKKTTKDVIATAFKLSRSIRKVGVLAGVCFGFIGNRMFLPYVREAELMMLEGVSAERIDRVACNWGMAMGPHAVTDLSGQDVFFKIVDGWKDHPDDPAFFRVCKALFELERYGQKTSKGKYIYEGRKAISDPKVANIAQQEAEKLGIEQREISDDEIIKRLLCAMINEGALILEEGIAIRSGDIDVIYANGYGLPRYRGGPMFYADLIGLKQVYDDINEFRDRYGNRYWTPAPLLEQLAKQGKTFSEWSQHK